MTSKPVSDQRLAVMLDSARRLGIDEYVSIYTELMALRAAHPDDLAVDRFAVAMKTKLAQKRAEGRGGWENKSECSAEFLSRLLLEHVGKGDPVDVGNLAMMLHQRGERISAALSKGGE